MHAPNGCFITAEGYEYVLNLSVASVALAVGFGLVGAAVQLAVFWGRPKPPEEAIPAPEATPALRFAAAPAS